MRAREEAVRADLGEHLERMLDAVGEGLFEDILAGGVSIYPLRKVIKASESCGNGYPRYEGASERHR